MKAKRLILALAATTVLASCGKGKEIKQEEAKDVAKDISKKVNDSSFEAPGKLQLVMSASYEEEGGKVRKASAEMNFSKPDYYLSVIAKSDDEKMGMYVYWEKGENNLYVVSDATEDGEREYVYTKVSADASSVESKFNTYAGSASGESGAQVDIMDVAKSGAALALQAVSAVPSSSAGISIGDNGVSYDYHYYSAGEGCLVVEGTTTMTVNGEKTVSKGSITIENYLLTKYSAETKGLKMDISINYNRANLAKPNLSGATESK